MRLAAALRLFWLVRGYRREGRGWLAAVLALPDAAGGDVPPGVRGRALLAAGFLAGHDGDLDEARERCRASLALLRAHGDRPGTAFSLQILGLNALSRGDVAAARPLLEAALAIRREVGDREEVAHSLNHLAMLALREGDRATAGPLFEEGLAIRRGARATRGALPSRSATSRTRPSSRATPPPRGSGSGSAWRPGARRRAAGDRLAAGRPRAHGPGAAEYGEARRLLEDELGAEGTYHNEEETMLLLLLAGIVAAELGAHDRARSACAQGLALGRRGGHAGAVAVALEAVAWVAAAWGEAGRALRLAAAARSASAERLRHYALIWQVAVTDRLALSRRALDEVAAGAALAGGQALTTGAGDLRGARDSCGTAGAGRRRVALCHGGHGHGRPGGPGRARRDRARGPQRAGARGGGARGPGADQPPDRRRAGDRPGHGVAARRARPGQAGRPLPCPDRRVGHGARPHALRGLTGRPGSRATRRRVSWAALAAPGRHSGTARGGRGGGARGGGVRDGGGRRLRRLRPPHRRRRRRPGRANGPAWGGVGRGRSAQLQS